jgi:DNA-binding response OmpR family regulator
VAKIVLIEDNPDLRELLTSALAEKGHSVWEVSDAEAAFATCKRVQPDVVVTDLIVPHSEMLDILVTNRGERAPRMVVISGALDSPAAASRAAYLAGSHVLAKPFKTGALVRLIEEVLTDSPAGV